MQFLGFGSGADGALSISVDTTEAPIDSSCSGTSGTATLTVGSSLSFAANQIVLVHQSRGTSAGNWELAQVASYVGTTLTLRSNLVNSYVSSGADAAQVRVVPQYTSVTVNTGVTWTAKAWNGSVGGILAYMCNGLRNVMGTISVKGKGYRGGTGTVGGSVGGNQGEGTAGAGSRSTAANGNGGGGGSFSGDNGLSAGGGEHGGGATSGQAGSAGSTAGSVDATTFVFGGGGGEGGISAAESGQAAVAGQNGGGAVVEFCASVTTSGAFNLRGNDGPSINNGHFGVGAPGGGGAYIGKIRSGALGTSLIVSTGGAAGTNGSGSPSGDAGTGRNRIEACTYTGTFTPSESASVGGKTWCLVPGQII